MTTTNDFPLSEPLVIQGYTAGLAVLGVVLLTVITLWLIFCCCLLKYLQQRKKELVALQSKINDIEYNFSSLDVVRYRQHHIKQDDINLKPLSTHSSSGTDSAYIELDDYHAGLMELEKFMMADEMRTNVTIRDVGANVYGLGVRASQMYNMAQDYFEKSKSVKPLYGTPLEGITIRESRREPKQKERSRLRPTSLLAPKPTGASAQAESAEGHQFAHGMFVHDDIGEQGGTIKVSGVTMEIPKGALKERTTITVGIVWDKEKRPELLSKQALISPVVVCEPTGQQFLIPVKITMSHCALNVKQKWKTRLMKCEGPLSQASNWSNTDEQTVVKDHEVTFFVKHFTLYALIGESNGDQPCAKSVNLVTFTSLLRVGDFFKVRIYCVDSYKDEQHQKQIEYINKSEVKMGGKKASQDNALFFKNNGKNMLVSLKDISKGWDLSGVSMEEMPFESVWHSEIPSCTFIFDPKDKMSNKILCQFVSSQVDGDCSCQFKIAERVVVVDPISGIPVDASTRVSLANNEVNLPYSIHRQLIMSLDAPNALGNDWRGLAEEMGMNLLEVNYIESKHNPTSILLDKWKAEGGTLARLHGMFQNMHREDLVELLNPLCSYERKEEVRLYTSF